MKMYLKSLILCASLFVTVISPAFSQGIVICQHVGATDPATEGFSLSLLGGSVGPVTNDLGMNAWATALPQSQPGQVLYTYSLTPQQQSETLGEDWILSATLRDLTSRATPNAFVEVNSSPMYIGSETNGDPFVDGTRSNPAFVLSGGEAATITINWFIRL